MSDRSSNPRYHNGHKRRKLRARLRSLGAPCAICGKPIHYDEPSDSQHPWSFVVDEINPVSRWMEFGYSSASEAALDWNNLQACHYICNQMKSNRTMAELHERNNFTLDGDW